jgi:hypothetical protein
VRDATKRGLKVLSLSMPLQTRRRAVRSPRCRPLQGSVAPGTDAWTGWREPAPSAMFERQGAKQGLIWDKAGRYGGLPNGFEAENPGRQ